jgi:hypothetical protein
MKRRIKNMTAKVDGPSGWALDFGKGNDTETEEITRKWVTSNKDTLDCLQETLIQAIQRGDGDCLCLWMTTLRGLADDIQKILTAQPVVVVRTDGEKLQWGPGDGQSLGLRRQNRLAHRTRVFCIFSFRGYPLTSVKGVAKSITKTGKICHF